MGRATGCNEAFIGLGSNLGDRGVHLAAALEGLRQAGLAPRDCSSVWVTEPVDAPASPWFWNMVVRTATRDEPLRVLESLQAIELRGGRRPGPSNSPRPLDLDLLLLGDLRLDTAGLTLPHPRMWERRFVLEPLCEIDAGVVDPATGRTAAQALRDLEDRYAVRRLGRLAADGASG